MKKSLKIGIVQLAITENVEQNKEKLQNAIATCAKQGAELVVLQELHNTPYFCQTETVSNFDFAETIPGPSTNFYGKIAKRCGVVLVTSLFEKRAEGASRKEKEQVRYKREIVGA